MATGTRMATRLSSRLFERVFGRLLQRTGLNWQLTAIVSAAILGLALFSSLMNSMQASSRMRDYFLGQGQRIADNFARQSTLALLFHSPENARDVVSSTLAFPDVTGVQITDTRHQVLLAQAHGGNWLIKPDPTAAPRQAMLLAENSAAWLFAAPVLGGQSEASPFDIQEHAPQLLGYVHVQVSKGTLNRLTWSLMLGNLGITLSFAVILLVLVRLLTRRMTEPLRALSHLMRRARGGEARLRAAAAGPRELIEMAHAFNQMMTVLEQREAELKDSRDAAVDMAQTKARFAATVSHEVRTPLNGVVGMLDMLREMPLKANQRECVDVAWNASRTLIELINNILDFSKMEAGKLALQESDFDLAALLADVTELLAGAARQKGVALGFDLAPGVPAAIHADALRLRQILINLLGNAVKFTDRGEALVLVTTATVGGVAGLRFEVRDTGIGMSADVQRHLFESYVQPDPSTTRRYGGTGLGLAICRQLVTLMGGAIDVASTPGEGTSFVFTVRCAAAESALPARPAQQAPAWPAALPALAGPQPVAGMRVLVAEDNRTNQMVAAGMLSMHGCVCEFAANGREAVAALARQRYDLVLMDCSMPEMDGYEATAHIRALEPDLGRRTPIVAMTANTQLGDAEKCLKAGMDDYLAKPITLVELRRKLERWLPASGQSHDDAPIDAAVFDKLREILGPALPHAVTPFLEDAPAYLLQLEQAVAAHDQATARARAHALKGAAGNLGASLLAALAQEAEQLAQAGRTSAIGTLLPRLRAAHADVATLLHERMHGQPRGPAADAELTGVQQAHVLIVDDDRSTRTTLRHTLQRDGFRVDEAADGAQALAMLLRCQPDVILMDAVMPVMDGFTACARLQELPGGAGIPVLMITALQDNNSVERAFAAGASDYIPKPIHYAVLSQRVRRIIEANRAEKKIRQLAYNDVLTGLPNRTLFFELLGQGIDHAARANTELAVLFMDLDRFKYVNDNLGHGVGDRLLLGVAQRVRATVRGLDTVARLGGDEFTVVLTNLDGPGPAADAAHDICRALAAPFQIDGHDIFVTSSVGIAMYPRDGLDVATLVKHADSAMYRAKRTNSGYKFYEASMEMTTGEHVRLESDLRRALDQHQLEVFYQPQVAFADDRIVAMEALVRWRHPTRGLVPPAEFIPLAEETGLINRLGDWVLRAACTQLQAWIGQGLPPLRVAVNLSVRQLLQADFAATVQGVLAETGLPPHLLELEITESTLMENAQETLAALHTLRELGVRLSIDDFGTGYSSLSYLKRFPVDIIKIDRSFVRDIPQDADDAAIVTAILALAHSLRLEVVAEGVETPAQRRFLHALDCDLLQGYLISPPVPAAQFAELVLARQALAGLRRA